MRFLPCLALASSLLALPAWGDEDSLAAPHHLNLLDDGAGGGLGYGAGWTPEDKTLGLGLQLGFPSALTLEYVTSSTNSLVAGLGLFGYRFFTPALSFDLDYLWHPGTLGRSSSLAISWYVGVGGWLTLYENGNQFTGYQYGGDSNLAVVVRIPIGLDLSLGPIPLMFYVELVPALLVFPNIDIGLGASIGGRVFF